MADPKPTRCGACFTWFMPLTYEQAVDALTDQAALRIGTHPVKLALEQQASYCPRCNRRHFPGVFAWAARLDERQAVELRR